MRDCVIDATVVSFSNESLNDRQNGNLLDRRLNALERVVSGAMRLRYNPQLLREYEQQVRAFKNDAVQAFFELLTERAVIVKGNKLTRQMHAVVVLKCRWPGHDQHLIAAALDGIKPLVVITERNHATCAACVKKATRIELEDLGS